MAPITWPTFSAAAQRWHNMDPLTIVAALANIVPGVLHLFGHDTAAATAQQVVDIAQTVTGSATPDLALAAIKGSPDLQLQFQKAILEQKVQLQQIDAQRAKDDADADNEADKTLTARMAAMEGTASDLKAIPYAGAVMLFLRGSQRIVIGYGTAWMDWEWLTGGVVLGDFQQRLLFTASLLVFVVLFGERAVKNIAPLVIDLLGQRKGNN
jgi:hypothetical protein